MTEMGFAIDPSTAGSSVRFDPPDKRDKVSRRLFFKILFTERVESQFPFINVVNVSASLASCTNFAQIAHPYAILKPNEVRRLGRRLHRHYGWNVADFLSDTFSD